MNGLNMAEKLKLGPEVRELKLGPTFSNSKATAFHTLRCKYSMFTIEMLLTLFTSPIWCPVTIKM